MRNMSDRRDMNARAEEQRLREQLKETERERDTAVRKRTHAQQKARELDDKLVHQKSLVKTQGTELTCVKDENKLLRASVSKLETGNHRLEGRLKDRQLTLDTNLDKRRAAEMAGRAIAKENASLQQKVQKAEGTAERAEAAAAADKAEAAARAEEARAEVAELERAVEEMDEEIAELREWQRERTPASQRKAVEALGQRRKQQRHAEARARFSLAFQDSDLRVKDMAAVLESEGKFDLIFDTKEAWERKMTFATTLCETLQSAWSVDLSVDFHSEFAISQRDMDGMRFTLSHDIINGRPRPRVLISNPHDPKQKLNFPQPLRSRCEWVAREKEREAALELISPEGVETCERDFDKTLDALVARDESLITDREYTAERPFAFVVGFDGADSFTHVTLRLVGYRDDVAAESELKAAQLAVAMGDDHYPNLEKVIAPRIGPAASRRKSITFRSREVPAEATLCLDLSAARSAYGRRHGKPVHYQLQDVQFVPKFKGDDLKGDFGLVDRYFKPNKVADLRLDAHRPRQFPFKCQRPGCKHPIIKDEAQLNLLMAELAALKANKTVKGKEAYAAAIATHANLHGQQRPYEDPVTDLEPMTHLIVDLLHAMDLNIPKVVMKYSLLDPALLTPDMREEVSSFFAEIGCMLDCREKAERDASRKWFHGSVWHYDFVLGTNHKSYGLYANIFQMCLIVYGVKREEAATSTTTASSSSASPPSRKRPAAAAIVDDFSDSEGKSEEEEDEDANLDGDDIMAELNIFFGANAARVKLILKLWNAYADLYNAFCDEWTSDLQSYRDERAYKVLLSSASLLDLLNTVSNRRHKSAYPQMLMTAGAKQVKQRGGLWPYSTRAVEGRGGQLKKIGRRIICWRRRCQGTYKRNIKRKGVARTIVQGYNSAPERQLMRASCFREERAHTQKRSRVATTGRNTLARSIPKVEMAALPELGDVLAPECVKRLCLQKRE